MKLFYFLLLVLFCVVAFGITYNALHKKPSIPMVLCSITVSAQNFKLGELELSDAVAREYLLDCYQHPDTVSERHSTDFGCCTNCTMHMDQFSRCNQLAAEFNQNLRKNSLSGEIVETHYYKAYQDTTFEHGQILWSSGMNKKQRIANNKKQRGKVVSIKTVPTGSYKYSTGKYLIPRKPTEIDFIKYLARKKLTSAQPYPTNHP